LILWERVRTAKRTVNWQMIGTSISYWIHPRRQPPSPICTCGHKLIMKNGVFWVVTPCGSCKNRRFGGAWRFLHQGDKNRW
jgi:hypothetical protein